MIINFQDHLNYNFSILTNKKILIAVSGGLDSMVLLHLFQNLHYDIAVAHCNFRLRDQESDADQQFVIDYCSENNIEVFSTQFDTQSFAGDYKLSIQVAARNLRYNWFYELLTNNNYDYVITAHHADDSLETFFINLSRGTGLDGLIGIPAQNNKIIRPLLDYSRHDIATYAHKNKIIWREDSSNNSDKYLRNKIRHQLIPVLKDINPDFIKSFVKTQSYLQETQSLVNDATVLVYRQVVTTIDNQTHININKLKKVLNYKTYLYQWLHQFGFAAWHDIYKLIDGQSGKIIYSNDYQIFKNRNLLIVAPITQHDTNIYFVQKNQLEVNFPIKLSFSKVADNSKVSKNSIFVDADKIIYPLTIRKWAIGDVFAPFGMNGKSKNVSKFFKDEKLSLLEKQKMWLLLSDNKIIWIVGLRQDNRFRITPTTEHQLEIAQLS